MLRAGVRLCAEAMLLGTALFHAGCAGTPVRFETPAGARVRIDGGSAGTIPFERGIAPGVHEVEVEAPPEPGAAGGRALRGLLVIFESASGDGVHFGMDRAELARSLEDGSLLWTGVGPLAQEGGILKAAEGGVAREDPDVALALARDGERTAALEAARALQEGTPGEAAGTATDGPTVWKVAAAAVVIVLLVAVVVAVAAAVYLIIDPIEIDMGGTPAW